MSKELYIFKHSFSSQAIDFGHQILAHEQLVLNLKVKSLANFIINVFLYLN